MINVFKQEVEAVVVSGVEGNICEKNQFRHKTWSLWSTSSCCTC